MKNFNISLVRVGSTHPRGLTSGPSWLGQRALRVMTIFGPLGVFTHCYSGANIPCKKSVVMSIRDKVKIMSHLKHLIVILEAYEGGLCFTCCVGLELINGGVELHSLQLCNFTIGEDHYGRFAKYNECLSVTHKVPLDCYLEEHFLGTTGYKYWGASVSSIGNRRQLWLAPSFCGWIALFGPPCWVCLYTSPWPFWHGPRAFAPICFPSDFLLLYRKLVQGNKKRRASLLPFLSMIKTCMKPFRDILLIAWECNAYILWGYW